MYPTLRAKLLLAFQGWLVGFDGQFEFENIGDSYIENKVPYVGMRTLPALFGSAIPAVVYAIMRESGYPRIVGLFSASLVLFGKLRPVPSNTRALHEIDPAPFDRQCPRRPDSLNPPGRANDPLHGARLLFLHPLLQAPLFVRLLCDPLSRKHNAQH